VRYAFLSDVHGRVAKIQAVLADARQRDAIQIVCLGDAGGDECMTLLRQAGAVTTFGNYEVSGWPRLAAENRAWVQAWPPLLAGDTFLAVHAAPWWPDGLHTLEEFAAWRQQPGRGWRALFPYLTDDEDYLWQALAELETAGKAVLFHGHTHRQTVWRCGPAGRLQQVRTAFPTYRAGTVVRVQPEHRYLVGVGSVGEPEDGAWSEYTLYDQDEGWVELVRLGRTEA